MKCKLHNKPLNRCTETMDRDTYNPAELKYSTKAYPI
jgi:hypothetical protein